MKRLILMFCGMLVSVALPVAAQERSALFLSADSLKRGELLDPMQGYFYLAQNWRYHPGDPAEAAQLWTRADFADSAWEVVDAQLPLARLPASGWNGSGWFRLHLTVDSLLLNRPLAFNLFHYGASEVYLDGVLLHQFGKVGGSRAEEEGFNAIAQQPKFLVFRQTQPLIAVRYSGFNVLHHRPPTVRNLGFEMAVGDLNRSNILRAQRTRIFSRLEAIEIAIPLTFAMLHLLLFLFYRRDRANFYFALFTAMIAAWGVLDNQPFLATNAELALFFKRMQLPYAMLLPLAGLCCLYAFFYNKLPRQFFPIAVAGIGVAVWNWFASAPMMTALMFVLPLLEMLRVVITVIRGKAPGAWIIGVGFAAFSLSLLAFLLLVGVFDIFSLALFYGLIYGGGVSSLLLSMSIYLSHNVARTSRSLEAEMKKSLQLKVDNARKEVELQKAAELKAAYQELDAAHTNLKATQQQLVTQEKLASLGQLTAGIAHEIKNPLNFVNNFAALSVDLMKELNETLTKQKDKLGEEVVAEIEDLLTTLEQNAEKINHHGQRADNIVKSMMQHARGSSGQRELADINHLLDEAVNLTYHGLRANDAAFNITIEKEYDATIGKLEVVPQDLSRVFLNIINNACYAAFQKKKDTRGDFSPTLSVSTKNVNGHIEIRIRDNGNGIPKDIREKIFNPFFTTKPTGQGTGLGLSISYDIIVQQHRGEIRVETEEGKFSEFVVLLPRN